MEIELAPQALEQAKPQPDLLVLCKNCEHPVARVQDAFDFEGLHEYTFRNPGGYSFHVLCYREAAGAASVGTPTAEATWFAGYGWSFAVCEACQSHLGWWYHASDSKFAGLIATRLIRPTGTVQ